MVAHSRPLAWGKRTEGPLALVSSGGREAVIRYQHNGKEVDHKEEQHDDVGPASAEAKV